ncbi:MAG: hypothetical protein CMP51_01770 [Flavobacteriales bacterium]|nr:hypothetical protein [Flavobacteriales bacterium]|tara:strand:- start:178 stop:1260 length:1083 start_codon:yes stop_codon:yes gene_type:complete
MNKKILISCVFFVLSSLINTSFSQCTYSLISILHNNCYGDNNGSITVSVPNPNATYWWILPDGSYSGSSSISNLFSGYYVINVMENFIVGDTSSQVICAFTDTITIEETIPITANFILSNNCSINDSVDVNTSIYGGTSPYNTLWTQISDTSRNLENLPTSNTPYTLSITDANGCQKNQYLNLDQVQEIQTFMMSENVICKDDNTASARVFVEYGTPPFIFSWSNGDVFVGEESSQINNLYPGKYKVIVKDTMGCEKEDSIVINTNPKECIKIYKVFSPNGDGIHDFWELKNINFYPEALIEVYDRLGNVVYRRRNYENSYSHAFNGKLNGRDLPSGTYYYVVDLENDLDIFKGTLTIVR